VVVPVHSGAFSALGCLVSPLRYDAVQTYRARLDAWEKKPAEDRFHDLEERCLAPLLDEGVKTDRIALVRSVDLRYIGQNYEIEVPWREGAVGLRDAFEKRHRQLYGYASGETVECVNLRVVARVDDHVAKLAPLNMGATRHTGAPPARRTPKPPLKSATGDDARAGEQRAYFTETGEVALRRYHRARLVPARSVRGPALIEDEWSTTLVGPGQRATADRFGNLVIENAR
jgi:N-methylhydantoinase A